MATSISYKSNQLASFTNATKTLKTAGKYVEGDIVVTNTTTINSLSVTPSELTQTFNANGVDGYKPVTVAAIPASYIIPTGTITITTNGAHNVTSYASANVNVQPNLTTTAVTATSTTQTITPPSGYVGFSAVTVNAITLVTYYTGITTPASNFGNNGDIYLVTD